MNLRILLKMLSIKMKIIEKFSIVRRCRRAAVDENLCRHHSMTQTRLNAICFSYVVAGALHNSWELSEWGSYFTSSLRTIHLIWAAVDGNFCRHLSLNQFRLNEILFRWLNTTSLILSQGYEPHIRETSSVNFSEQTSAEFCVGSHKMSNQNFKELLCPVLSSS